MTEIEIARRMTDFTLGQRVLHLTDSLDLTDEVTALLEEAAQRLIDGDTDDPPSRQPAPAHRR